MSRVIVVVAFILLSACSQKSESENADKILSYVSSSGKSLTDITAIFVIPNGGCGGCISNFENKLYESPDSLNKILVVYTEIEDAKKLRLLLPKQFFKHNNIIFDYTNKLRESGFSSFYPYCITLNNGVFARDFFLDGSSEINERYVDNLFNSE